MKKIYWILSALFLFVASCQQSDIVNSSSDPAQIEEVKPEVALKVANNFNAFFSVSTRKESKNARTGDKEKTVKKVTPFKDDSGKPLYYVITYKEGGFVIVSAEKKTMPILAFSETSDFPVEKELPNGVRETMGGYTKSIKKARVSNSPADPRVLKEWERLGNTTGIDELVEKAKKSGARTNDDPVDPPCEDSQIYIGPFTAAWGQGANWNSQMPLQAGFGCTTMPNGRMLTGCVATAMAEVMNFHHFPNTFNWTMMGATQTETARLMRLAANSVNMVYQCDGSFAFGNAIAPGLVNGFGYSSSATYSTYNVNTVINEITNFGRPVILGGFRSNFGGHAWVCDGYYQYISCVSSNGPMLYMNWGWDGQHNGFYSTSVGFDPFGQNTYFTDLVMVTSIKP